MQKQCNLSLQQTTHRQTLSLGVKTEFKLESPTNSGWNSSHSVKSSLKGLLTPDLHSSRSQAQSSHDQNFLNVNRRSILQMMQTYSQHYDLIQQSDPLEQIHYIHHPQSQQKSQQTSFEIQNDGKLAIYELKQNMANQIHITRFKFHYFYIKIQNQESPLQVYCKSLDSKLQTLRIYISTTSQYPTKFNCEAIIQSKYFKYQERRHLDFFTAKNLFFSLYSEEDSEVQILSIFGNKVKQRQKIQKEKPNYDKYRNYLHSFKSETLLQDKIQNNLDVRQHSKENKKNKLLQTSEILEQRVKHAISKKREIIEEKKLELMSKFQATNVLKQIRQKQQMSFVRKSLLQKFQIHWIRILILFHFGQNVWELLEQNRKKNKNIAQGRLIAWRYRITRMIKIKETGSTVDERNRFKLCLTAIMYAQQIREKVRNNAGKAIHYFLKLTYLYMRVIIKHKLFSDKINYVKRVFRNQQQKKKAYRDRLFRALIKHGQEILGHMSIAYTNPKKKSYQLDSHNLSRAMDDFILQKKMKLQLFVQKYVREKEKKKKVVDFAINLMQPELYDTPSYEDLYGIYKTYVHFKKLLKA